MSDVIELDLVTRNDIPAPRILAKAAGAKLTAVVVVGFDAAGDFYFASSKADGADALWLMEVAKKKLLELGDQ